MWRLLFALLAALLAGAPVHAQDTAARMLVQSSPLAGFQFHAGKALWDQLKVGAPLTLVREPENPHDRNAVRVDWQGHTLGYVPRRENQAVAMHMDRGGRVEARISRLSLQRDPWQRIEFEIYVRL